MTDEKRKSIINYFWKYTAPELGFVKEQWRDSDHHTAQHARIMDNNGLLQVGNARYKIYRIPSLYSDTRVFLDFDKDYDDFRLYLFEEGIELLYTEIFIRR